MTSRVANVHNLYVGPINKDIPLGFGPTECENEPSFIIDIMKVKQTGQYGLTLHLVGLKSLSFFSVSSVCILRNRLFPWYPKVIVLGKIPFCGRDC